MCVRMHVCMYVHTYACMHVCTYVCKYICIVTYLHIYGCIVAMYIATLIVTTQHIYKPIHIGVVKLRTFTYQSEMYIHNYKMTLTIRTHHYSLDVAFANHCNNENSNT